MEEYQKKYIERQKEEVLFNIEGENITRTILNKITPEVLKVFEGLKEGEQILKKGFSVGYGEMLLKYKNPIKEIFKRGEEEFESEEISPQLFLNCSEYSVYIEVKIRFNKKSENGFLYYDSSKYILNLKEGCLNKLYDFELLEMINGEEELKTMEECFILLEELNQKKELLKHYKTKTLIK